MGNDFMMELAKVCGWSLLAAMLMGVGTGLAIKIFDLFTPGVDEMDELKKGNMAVAVVLAAVVLSVGMVIAMAVHGPGNA